jgi:hypothetical protein
VANLLNNYSLAIIIAFITFVFTTLILDNFKFSNVKFIRLVKYFVLGFLFLYLYFKFFSLPSVYAAEKTPPIDPVLSTKIDINITKDAVNHLGDGLITIGSNIGLGATVGATAGAVASVVKTAPISPVQKVGAVLLGATVGASIHVGATAINRGRKNNNESSTNNNNLLTSDIPSPKYDINSPLESNEILTSNYVEDLLYSLLSLNICTLLLFLLFLLSLINKLILVKGINLNFLDKILPEIYRERIKSFISSIYNLSSKTSTIYSVYLIIVLFISCLGSIYFSYELINNFEEFSRDYLYFINKYKK